MQGVVISDTLHGKNVVHMKRGNDELHFFYDAQNKPAVVVYNGVAYSYVKNLQGDIVAILNSAGTAVVNYAYDAWGHPISKTGSMAGTLGTLNPFRYRGYVYDEETGLYYLRSRYFASKSQRFINADAEIIEKNLFAYCLNNPIRSIDEEGTHTVDQFMDGEPDDPESDAVGGGGLGAGGQGTVPSQGASTSSVFSPNVSALNALAKSARNTGVDMIDAKILIGWAQEYGVNWHPPAMHTERSGIWSYTLHITLFKYHIRVY